jgi:hypothetical protein
MDTIENYVVLTAFPGFRDGESQRNIGRIDVLAQFSSFGRITAGCDPLKDFRRLGAIFPRKMRNADIKVLLDGVKRILSNRILQAGAVCLRNLIEKQLHHLIVSPCMPVDLVIPK